MFCVLKMPIIDMLQNLSPHNINYRKYIVHEVIKGESLYNYYLLISNHL